MRRMADTAHAVVNELEPLGPSRPPVNGVTDRATVVLADNQLSTRQAVRIALEHHGFSIVAEVATADEAVAAAVRHRPQLCVLDVEMPGGAVEAASRISSRLPDTKIAMLTTCPSEGALLDAVRAGADGYLPKRTAPDRLTVALNALLLGEPALPRALTGSLVREVRETSASRALVDGEPASVGHRSLLLYLPRLGRHLFRRLRSGMSPRSAWKSARVRMDDYR